MTSPPIDLHLHSTASDGLLSPAAVMAEAHRRGVRVVALTDHDTMDGVAEARKAAAELGLTLIAGIELNTDSPAGEVHVLGYYVDEDDAGFQQLLASRRRGRAERTVRIVERLQRLGYDISFADVQRIAGDGALARPHVARALTEAGYVADMKEAFDRYLHRGGPAYVKRESFSPREAIDAIVAAGGVPVLAHPGRIKDDSVIEELVADGLQGLECYYPEHDAEQTERYVAFAAEHDLVVTGGTDFHGPDSHHEKRIGAVSAPADVVQRLLERRRRLATHKV